MFFKKDRRDQIVGNTWPEFIRWMQPETVWVFKWQELILWLQAKRWSNPVPLISYTPHRSLVLDLFCPYYHCTWTSMDYDYTIDSDNTNVRARGSYYIICRIYATFTLLVIYHRRYLYPHIRSCTAASIPRFVQLVVRYSPVAFMLVQLMWLSAEALGWLHMNT